MTSPTHHPLLGRSTVLGLAGVIGLAFAATVPLSLERETQALHEKPDLVALSYLRLGLERDPEDAALRVKLAERVLATGQFQAAREVLEPFFTGAEPAPADAEMLRAEIEYRAWAAASAEAPARRQAAFERLVTTLEHTRHEGLTRLQAERVASFCAEAGLAAQRASILHRLAAADLEDDARLAAAEHAHLEAGAALAAAQLAARRAIEHPERGGAVHAARALEHALAAEQPGEAITLWRALSRHFHDDARVMELGMAVLAGVDDVEALAVASALLQRRPNDPALRARIEALRRWTATPRTRASLSAPLEPPTFGPAEHAGLDGAALKDAASDIERAALLESLGSPRRALALLDAAERLGQVDARALYELRLGIQLRSGHERAALATLEAMDERFGPTRQSLQRRVDLLLALGETARALELLSAAGESDVETARQVSELGWELGEIERVRAAYRVIAQSAEATPHDLRRSWLLEREAGDLRASTRVALLGLERFRDPEFSRLALDTAILAQDERLLASVLRQTEALVAQLTRDVDDLRLHVSLRHGRAYQALRDNDPARARRELSESGRLLGLARPHAGELGSAYLELASAQERQLFELALASDDRALLARTYPDQAERLSARDRVLVLHRLGRDTDAVNEAAVGIRSGAAEGEALSALQDDADTLARQLPRQVFVLGDVLETEGLSAVRIGGGADYSWDGGERAGARVEITRLGAWEGPSVYLPGRDELAAEVSLGIARSELDLGVVAQDGGAVRPLARFEQGIYRDAFADVAVAARVNDRSRDTPVLRVLGVEDELAARASFQLGDGFAAFAGASGKLYSDRDRDYLGAGATVDGWLGKNWALPAGVGRANARVAAYVAPRFAESDAAPVPDGTTWVGLGTTLSRGQLSVAPVAGRRLSVLADASGGWLVPQAELGWSAKLGLGISVFGSDQLSLAGSASNVVSRVPGYAVYTLAADYAVSQW